jgi:NAD(P)-dependent dehydrogenase (short-subunit alcohol dehydrogenase family)
MAESLAAAGADICIWGTNAKKNENAISRLETHGTRCLSLQCDVSIEDRVEEAFDRTLKDFGRVDACFANAGMGGAGTQAMKTSTEEWRRILGINLDGAFFTLRRAAKHMASRDGGGSLVGTASIAGIMGNPRSVHYATAKSGLIAMIKSFSVGMARYNVRANAILPGWTHTPMVGPLLELKPIADNVMPRIPMRRWGRPSDFGGIAVYLASDASSYHTGDTIIIDGGYMLF